MAREKKRRAGLALARAKQMWVWSTALIFSYVDLISTVTVGLQYLAIGEDGHNAARVTFGMLAGSLGVQALVTYFLGEFFHQAYAHACSLHCFMSPCKTHPISYPLKSFQVKA